MSSKRKTTKPMRVAETSNQVDYKHLLVPVCAPQQQATLSHASHPNYKNEFNGTSPGIIMCVFIISIASAKPRQASIGINQLLDKSNRY